MKQNNEKRTPRNYFFAYFGGGDSNFAVFSSPLKAKNKELGL
ncbi:hypothetical protein [uncultured Parasutterella sp.]|jgi:hypothetical protein|nr:hypothetical protein [uncultured Parasutterella sp.]